MDDIEPKSPEPYRTGIIKGNPWTWAKKREATGKIVVIHDVKFDDRGYRLMSELSRAVLCNEIHELISTAEDNAGPGTEVNEVGIIGFFEITTGGVLAVGDRVIIEKNEIGMIGGFDETHFPNHINVIIKTDKTVTGFDLNIRLEEKVVFIR
jgi:hypothetical protein